MNILLYWIMSTMPIFQILNMKSNKSNSMKITSLIWCFILIMMYNIMLINTDETNQFQLMYNISWLNLGFNMKWGNILTGVDGLALLFIGLSLILMPICMLSSWNSIEFLLKEFIILLHITLTLLILLFSVLELMSFYILFEMMLMPMFLIMGMWGSSEEKVEAAFYFFFYTLMGSFLMLLSMFKMYTNIGNTNMLYLYFLNIQKSTEIWMLLGMGISLSMKIPMIPFHLWLPKAHVEAPMAGSVLLAGILLKLGGYGFFSLMLPITCSSLEYFQPILMTLSLLAIIYGALSTLSQNDLKKLMAYSSMSHMGVVTLCMFTKSTEGMVSSMLMMLAHGFVSSAMFICSFIIYTSHHSSMMKYYKGLTMTMPMFSTLTLLLSLGNIGFPLTLNFISEFMALKSFMKISLFSSLMFCVGSFMTLIYTLFMFNSMFFGVMSPYLTKSSDLMNSEFQTLALLMTFTLFFGMMPNTIMKMITTQMFYFNTL